MTNDVAMDLRADFGRREVVRTGGEVWRPSPITGAERYLLDRLGEESARETSIVRYAAGARFGGDAHGGGEEFLVLDGVFEDEHGTYPKGTWLRSPHLSAHHPFTGPDGALIYVKTGHLVMA